MTFPWLSPTQIRSGADARLAAALRDLRERAALYYRLGFTADSATARLAAAVAWDFEPSGGTHRRPAGLSDDAIGAVVRETFARRPSGAL